MLWFTVVTRSRTSFAMDGPCSLVVHAVADMRIPVGRRTQRVSVRGRERYQATSTYTHGTCLRASVSSSASQHAQGIPPSIVVRCRWNSHVPSAVAGGRRWPCRCPSPSCGGPAHIRAGGQLVVSSGSIGCGGDATTTYSDYYAYYCCCCCCCCCYRGQWCARSCDAVRDLMAVCSHEMKRTMQSSGSP